MKQVLALDFDGVLWDSVGECFVMAHRAYQNLYGLPCADLEAPFRRGRWLVRTGGDFLLVLQLAMADPEGDLTHYPQEQFLQLQRDRAQACQEFAQEFYQLRQTCRDQHWQEWLSYQQPYPQFLQQLPALREMFAETVICTTKDSESARKLLATVGLDLPIYGREQALHKGDQIAALCRDCGVSPEQIFFLDDLLENLHQVRPTGARCALAAWGYNTAAERQRAQQEGFPVLDAFTMVGELRQRLCPSPG